MWEEKLIVITYCFLLQLTAVAEIKAGATLTFSCQLTYFFPST